MSSPSTLALHRATSSFQSYFFFFNDTATTEIYTLSLHDALPIFTSFNDTITQSAASHNVAVADITGLFDRDGRSEEHTSELQSRQYLVCRLLLEKKKKAKEVLHFWREFAATSPDDLVTQGGGLNL